MLCAEVRQLLDQGVLPGSTKGRNPLLGFHLSTCSECRGYRERPSQPETVVVPQTLDAGAGVAPQQPVPTPVAPPVMLQPSRPRNRIIAGVALFALAVALGLVGWFGLPLYRAYQYGLQMYQPSADADDRVSNSDPSEPQMSLVAIAPATITATPTARPTHTARPTATPKPTATAASSPTPTPILAEARPLTIAFLGLDARPGEGLNARSDALILARLDPVTGDVALLSLPRDTWVPIPGYGESKINASFYVGEQRQPNGGGLALAKETLAKTFTIQIDYAVAIDFAGFRSLIDALGGITVDVPKEIYDGQFPTDDYGYKTAHFLPGPQQMDGETALVYARTRHPDSDFERIKRQQLVLLGIARRLGERGALQNLHEADLLAASLAPYVHTDMPPDLALSMLWNMRNTDPANIRRYTVDGSMLWETSVNGAYALVPQQGVLPALGQKLLSPNAP